MNKHTPNASVTSKGEPNIDFSALDEKLGKGVAEALSVMIRKAVVHGITSALPELVKTVGSSSKSESDCVKPPNAPPGVTPPSDTLKTRCKGKKRGLPVSEVKKELHFGEKLPPGRPWFYYKHYDPNMDGDDMPHCLDLVFWPTKKMKFFSTDLAIAAYIFGNNLDPEEVLVPNDHCCGTHKTLLTIMPGKPIIGDVLILVASMLTKRPLGPGGGIVGYRWYLPPTFSQIVLSPKQNCSGTLKYIKDNFTGVPGCVHTIFVPIYFNGHWFLIVVEKLGRTVQYLDSFKGCTLMEERKRVIDDVIKALDNFLSDSNLKITKYKFYETAVPQQPATSNDCGIWVAQWMTLYGYWGSDNKWVVNDYSRMRLAMDLVNREHNPRLEEIRDLAVSDWNKKMQQSVLQT